MHIGCGHSEVAQGGNPHQFIPEAIVCETGFAGIALIVAPVAVEVESGVARAAAGLGRIKELHAQLGPRRNGGMLTPENIAVERGVAKNQGALEGRNGLDEIPETNNLPLMRKRPGERLTISGIRREQLGY